jgi:NADP-dependent 3-hydroxy acid dehydrogenase YdfG
MSDSREEARFREHLAEMRRAAGGLGHDFANEFTNLDAKIERLGHVTAKEAKYLALDIQDDFASLGKAMDTEVRRIPQHIANAGIAIGSGASRAGAMTRDAFVSAGKKAKQGTKNALASAAGVRRTPMREWSSPSTGDDTGESR